MSLFFCKRTIMGSRNSAQVVHRCDFGETVIIHSYCDFCRVKLCILCIGKHISDGNEKHKIVPFQNRKSTLIYQKCRTHPHKICEFHCMDCENILVCSSCIASDQHGRHKFQEIAEVYKTKKEVIKRIQKS